MEYRKELKCFLRKLFIIVVLLFVPLFLGLKNTKNVSALYEDINAPFTVYWRSYSLGINGTPVNQSGAFTTPATSQTLLQNESGAWKNLYGFSIDFSISEPSNSWRYKSLNVKAELYQETWDLETNSNSIQDHINTVLQHNSLSVNTSRGDQYIGNKCTVANMYTLNGGSNIFSYTVSCTIQFTEYSDLYNAQLVLGTIQNAAGNSPLLGYTCGDSSIGSCNASIQLRGISYTVSGTDDPSYRELQEISTAITEQNEKENAAIDNIDGQSTSDIPNADSSQTTSIIGTISSFVSALGTIQTGTCSMTLPFPQFLGGDTVVNPCNGKDKAPTLVSVASSMFLIGIFVPFAFIVLKMIYNEIRSFTNG